MKGLGILALAGGTALVAYAVTSHAKPDATPGAGGPVPSTEDGLLAGLDTAIAASDCDSLAVLTEQLDSMKLSAAGQTKYDILKPKIEALCTAAAQPAPAPGPSGQQGGTPAPSPGAPAPYLAPLTQQVQDWLAPYGPQAQALGAQLVSAMQSEQCVEIYPILFSLEAMGVSVIPATIQSQLDIACPQIFLDIASHISDLLTDPNTQCADLQAGVNLLQFVGGTVVQSLQVALDAMCNPGLEKSNP